MSEKTITQNQSKKLLWKNAVTASAPIMMGYIPIGFAFGVLANTSGLSAFNAFFMSLFVFAGSAQLISVGLFAANASLATIIITTFIVNLRHMLMSAALSPYLSGWRKTELAGFSFELTDETFALHAERFANQKPRKSETFLINLTAQSSWVAGTILGVFAGNLITDVYPFALDYALPAMFIALLVLQIKNNRQIIVGLFSGILAILLLQSGLEQWYVIIATIIGATFGLGIEIWTKKLSS
jgi:4-azaleucine resistance transporter AzlC